MPESNEKPKVNNNINKDKIKNENKNIKKEGFFKKVLKSVKNFEKYEDFALEGLGKTTIYLLQIVAVFTLIIAIMTVYKFSNTLNNTISYLKNNIETFSYENGILEINSNEKLETEESINDFRSKIIIDTSELTTEGLQKYKEDISKEQNGIIVLRDKVLIKNDTLTDITEIPYNELTSKYNITTMDKQTMLQYLEDSKAKIYTAIFITIYLCMFGLYFISILLDALVLGLIGYIIAKITRVTIKFMSTFSMGVHALTLPIILNMLYVILNGFTGFTVKYFQFMYNTISFIYIITAIFIIKSDYIKRDAEVQKIRSEQEIVRAQIEAEKQKQEDEEAKRRDEKERKEQKKKEKDKNKKEEPSNIPDIGEKPEGSNV